MVDCFCEDKAKTFSGLAKLPRCGSRIWSRRGGAGSEAENGRRSKVESSEQLAAGGQIFEFEL